MTVEPADVQISTLSPSVTFIDPNNFGVYEVAQIQTSDITIAAGLVPAVRLADGALFAYTASALVIPVAYKVVPE